MSYAVRNTIILLITLFLFVGGTTFYTKYYQQKKIDDLTAQLEIYNSDYKTKLQISNDYLQLLDTSLRAKEIVQGYDKALYKNNSSYGVFQYLADLTEEDLEVFYDYVFIDSVSLDKYGIINSDIQGTGNYNAVVTFINKLEYGHLLNKVENISISPVSNEEDLNYVAFSFKLKSYYQKIPFEDTNSSAEYDETIAQSIYNPFKPLILAALPANVDELVEIEKSRLLGIAGTRIFIIDQLGKTRTLKQGDKVFMGHLETINTSKKEAIFTLNKGGINELYTLTIER